MKTYVVLKKKLVTWRGFTAQLDGILQENQFAKFGSNFFSLLGRSTIIAPSSGQDDSGFFSPQFTFHVLASLAAHLKK